MLCCRPQMFKVLQQVGTVVLCLQTTLRGDMSREEVIRTMAAALAADKADAVAAAALAREAEENTYIGRGLAVPHARLASLAQARVCLAACPEGVDWGGQRATLIAMLLVPEERPELHLRLLGTLARQLAALKGSSPELPALAAALAAAR